MSSWRRSGRTTAMVEKAVEMITNYEEKKQILILVHNNVMVNYIKNIIGEVCVRFGVSAEMIRQHIDIYPISSPDWAFRGSSWSVGFVDHAAWEIEPSKTARCLSGLSICWHSQG